MTLLVIFAMFITPLVLAWLMYNGTIDFEPENTRNLGQLVVPPVPLDWSGTLLTSSQNNSETSQSSLKGYWVILHQLPFPCAGNCRALVTELRQVHRASGKNQERIRIALIIDSRHSKEGLTGIAKIYPEFRLLSAIDPKLEHALGKAGQSNPDHIGETEFFLADPLGNIMMAYNGTDGPAKLSKDLKRLLTWSKLDKRP